MYTCIYMYTQYTLLTFSIEIWWRGIETKPVRNDNIHVLSWTQATVLKGSYMYMYMYIWRTWTLKVVGLSPTRGSNFFERLLPWDLICLSQVLMYIPTMYVDASQYVDLGSAQLKCPNYKLGVLVCIWDVKCITPIMEVSSIQEVLIRGVPL